MQLSDQRIPLVKSRVRSSNLWEGGTGDSVPGWRLRMDTELQLSDENGAAWNATPTSILFVVLTSIPQIGRVWPSSGTHAGCWNCSLQLPAARSTAICKPASSREQITNQLTPQHTDWLRAGWSGFDSRQGKHIFLLATASGTSLWLYRGYRVKADRAWS
jgi:hypothetical protein